MFSKRSVPTTDVRACLLTRHSGPGDVFIRARKNKALSS
ncbi:MAG: hypothetical protein JWM51_288 [Microbacteriaceae bacterium]|jgi:hypothetical protein|nr:hypothetical protein [Microbacteriaceae bacterium]